MTAPGLDAPTGTGLAADDLCPMAHREVTARPYPHPPALGQGLAGSLLAELILTSSVRLADDTAAVADPAPPADGLGRAVLGLLPSERGHPIRIASTAAEAGAIIVRVLRPAETRRAYGCRREPW